MSDSLNLLSKPKYSLKNDLFALAKSHLKLEHSQWSNVKYAIWIVMYHEAGRGPMIEDIARCLSKGAHWPSITVCRLIDICAELDDEKQRISKETAEVLQRILFTNEGFHNPTIEPFALTIIELLNRMMRCEVDLASGKCPTSIEVDTDLQAFLSSFATTEFPNKDYRDIERLRLMLALKCAGSNILYMDDGELQDSSEQPYIDFRLDSPERITHSLTERKRRRGANGQIEQVKGDNMNTSG